MPVRHPIFRKKLQVIARDFSFINCPDLSWFSLWNSHSRKCFPEVSGIGVNQEVRPLLQECKQWSPHMVILFVFSKPKSYWSESKIQCRTKGMKQILWRRPQHCAALTDLAAVWHNTDKSQKPLCTQWTTLVSCISYVVKIAPPLPRTPKQDPKCKTSSSYLVRECRSHHLWLEADTKGKGEKEWGGLDSTLKFLKSGLCSENGIPLLLLGFCFVLFPVS